MIATAQCNCKKDERLGDTASPEYFASKRKAVARYLDHKKNGNLYWAVHYQGKHMINVY